MIRPLVAAALSLALAAPAAARERSEIPEGLRWNLADLFPSEAAWSAARDDLASRIPKLAAERGRLGESAASLRRALEAVSAAQLELSRVRMYASALSDEDLRASHPREMRQSAERLAVDLDAATAWLRPEILAAGPEKIHAFLAQDPKLGAYRFFLDDVLRWRPHTLSSGEERVAAEAGNLAGTGESVFSVLADADLPWPTVKLSTGEEIRLDQSGYELARQSKVREDRLAVFDAFFGALARYERTIGAALYGTVRAHEFDKDVHAFRSTLEAALFRDAIPTTVYTQLLSDVHRSLPTLHRYLSLRKRMLGLSELRYQDLYAPLVASVDMRFTPEQAQELVAKAVAPLGPEYVADLEKGFHGRWTDYLPSTGKRSGAYSDGVWGVHPYQLLNFNGRYDDVSTLAHESGHSMHTFLADQAQPFPTHQYSIFVAEVASTLNENLLFHEMLSRAGDDATRLFLLGRHLETLRTTLFRQTEFAEFELAFHEKAEKGETLTGENLSQLYLKLLRAYYGHDEGVCTVPDLLGVEWAYIPHFHMDFYVYQYATSLVASTAIARAILDEAARRGGTKARDAYLRLLKAGGSRYPIELLRDAGVDMTTSKPFDAAIADMNATMDQMDLILARRENRPAPVKRGGGEKRRGR